MEEQLTCSLGGEKVNKSSSFQDIPNLIPPDMTNTERANNIDVDIVLTHLHGPSYQYALTRTDCHQQTPTQTNFSTHSDSSQFSSAAKETIGIPLSAACSQTNQPTLPCTNHQPPKSCLEKEFHRNKKILKKVIAKAIAKLDTLQELEQRASKSFLEVKKPFFECCELTDPLNFLEHLHVYLKRVPNEKKIDKVLECLKKCAQKWAEVSKECWTNYEDFKKSFIGKFWGSLEQNLLRREIIKGCYTNEAKDGSMTNYFINLVSQARWLPNQMPDKELIYEIMHHFPKLVQVGWYNSEKCTVLEAVEFLRKMDETEMLSNAQKDHKKCKYKACKKENYSKDCMSNRQKIIEGIQKSIFKNIAIKEGIKIAETAMSKMISPQQRQCEIRVFNEKAVCAIAKVNNLTTETCELEEAIITFLNNNKRPHFISPKFYHPLNFLDDLGEYLERIPIEHRTVEYIVDCLYGDARRWATIFNERWSNYDQFKKDFLDQYWGPAEQSLLKREIICSDWDIKCETMTQHFNRLVIQAKLLTPPIPERQLVPDIMCHFSERVQDAWQSSGQCTSKATAFLLKMDEEIYNNKC